jgi:hypothetical protein
MSRAGVHLGLPLSPAAPSAPQRSSMWTLFWPRGRQVRTALKNSDFSLFTSLTCTIPFITLLPLSKLHRRAGVRAGRPCRGSHWWVAAPPSPPRRAALPGGLASARRSRSEADIRPRSCRGTCCDILVNLEAQDLEAAMQWGAHYKPSHSHPPHSRSRRRSSTKTPLDPRAAHPPRNWSCRQCRCRKHRLIRGGGRAGGCSGAARI